MTTKFELRFNPNIKYEPDILDSVFPDFEDEPSATDYFDDPDAMPDEDDFDDPGAMPDGLDDFVCEAWAQPNPGAMPDEDELIDASELQIAEIYGNASELIDPSELEIDEIYGNADDDDYDEGDTDGDEDDEDDEERVDYDDEEEEIGISNFRYYRFPDEIKNDGKNIFSNDTPNPF